MKLENSLAARALRNIFSAPNPNRSKQTPANTRGEKIVDFFTSSGNFNFVPDRNGMAYTGRTRGLGKMATNPVWAGGLVLGLGAVAGVGLSLAGPALIVAGGSILAREAVNWFAPNSASAQA